MGIFTVSPLPDWNGNDPDMVKDSLIATKEINMN